MKRLYFHILHKIVKQILQIVLDVQCRSNWNTYFIRTEIKETFYFVFRWLLIRLNISVNLSNNFRLWPKLVRITILDQHLHQFYRSINSGRNIGSGNIQLLTSSWCRISEYCYFQNFFIIRIWINLLSTSSIHCICNFQSNISDALKN